MVTVKDIQDTSASLQKQLAAVLPALASAGENLALVSSSVELAQKAVGLLNELAQNLEPVVMTREVQVPVLPPNYLDVRAWADSQGQIIGAKGDGITDDTVMLQYAINTAERLDMVCYFSRGEYVVDPRVSLRPASGAHWVFHPEAVLVALPNADARTNVVYVDNVDDVLITGLKIKGDRLTHDYTQSSTTSEWGHGIKITKTCNRIVLRDFRITHCHGDGLSISAKDVQLFNGESRFNRRQGLTIGSARNLSVISSVFSDTGELDGTPGTKPMAGIDIEPDSEAAENILIKDCVVQDNGTAGVLMWVRSEVAVALKGIQIINNLINRNPNQIQSKAVAGSIEYRATGNSIGYTLGSGIRVEAGTTAVIANNSFSSLEKKRQSFTQDGRSSLTSADIRVISPTSATQVPAIVDVGRNFYA